MSKLELLINRCREIWEQIAVEPKMMDDMIDTFAKPDFDLDKVTDEDIKISTQNYINDIMIKINKEKSDGNRT
jgi:hypothetical protein